MQVNKMLEMKILHHKDIVVENIVEIPDCQ